MKKFILPLSIIFCLLWDLPLMGQSVSDSAGLFPPFSWDKVPVYIHFGNSAGLSDEEIEFVAGHSNLVCLEKSHGSSTHGSTEAGIEFDTKRLKTVNPDLKLIYYWNTFLDYSMFAASTVYNSHPEWWLYYQDGTLDLKNGRLKRYDLSNPEVREWWAEEVRKAIMDRSADGVFMDAFPQITATSNIDLWGQAKFDSIQEGLIKLIKLTREKTDSSAILMYNGIRNTDDLHFGMDYMELCDAAAIEHFDQFASTSRESIARDIDDMITAGKMGKMVIMKGWPGFNWTESEKMKEPYDSLLMEARENITFPLACFLVAVQPHSYFCYSWGYQYSHGMLDWYDEFDKPLGAPMGDAVINGWEYTREFEHCKVWVNIDTKQANIDWEKLPQKYTLVFSMIDDNTGNPIPGISVSIGDQTLETNAQGNAIFKFPESKLGYSIENQDYFPLNDSFDLASDTTIRIILQKNSANVKFRIFEGEAPLYKAEVEINETKLITNTVGIVVFEGLSRFEEFTYLVKKDGYQTVRDVLRLDADTTLTVYMSLQTSMTELPFGTSALYPNPAKSSIVLETTQRMETVHVMNLNGGIIRTVKPGEHSAMIDLSDLIPGIYLLKIELEGGRSEFKKFILSE